MTQVIVQIKDGELTQEVFGGPVQFFIIDWDSIDNDIYNKRAVDVDYVLEPFLYPKGATTVEFQEAVKELRKKLEELTVGMTVDS